MSIPILNTKLSLPPANPNLVRRQRLLSLLDEGLCLNHLLTLVCAPTGYGKTSLVSQWIHEYLKGISAAESAKLRFAWLSLDQEDNDLARFIFYIVAALQQIQPDFGQGILAALQNIRSTSPNQLATLLINEFTGGIYPSVFVLEDYHAINTQSIHDFMSYLIDRQPAALHLLIISRSDPPLPISRLRARGQLMEIRLQDLAMTEEETRAFLVERMKLDLSPGQLQLLEHRTEGWAAGLQLVALSLRHSKNISNFIQGFSGGHEYIADYLTDEVLEHQDEVTRDFLLHTSILKRLSAPLCEAVSRQPHADQMLEKLASTNTFLIPLDDQRQWYRYHALFADLLRKRLLQSDKEIVADLHCRAGEWYLQNNWMEQAVEHFLAGENYKRAATLIEKNAEQLLMVGQTGTYLRWLEAFPEKHLHAYPALVVYQGIAAMLLGKTPENSLSLLHEIVSSSAKYRGETDVLQALYLIMKGNAPEAVQLAESALQNLPPERVFLRILAADSLAMGHTLRGDLISATLAFEKVVEAAQTAGNVIMRLIGLANLAGLHYQQGHLHRAWEDYQKVFDLSQEQLGASSQPMGRALLGMGEVAREWNDLDAARKYLMDADEVFKQYIDIGLSLVSISLARVYFSLGEWGKVQLVLEEARQHSRDSKATPLDDKLTELMQARLWIGHGKLDQAQQWARQNGLIDRPIENLVVLAERSATAFELIQGEYLTLVRLYLAQTEPQKALEILDVMLSHNERTSQMRRVVEILVLQAIAYQQQDDEARAKKAFARALTLAEPENYVRTFIDEGQPVALLLRQAIADDCLPVYATNLLAAHTRQAHPSTQIAEKHRPVPVVNLVELLSERELEVLGLIAQGLTNQEIGLRLHITLSTVKGHTSNIYGKLGVKNRTQAIKMAQNLGLLPRI
jgi:LuxR family maltose regulon positive regulatory protein